MAKLSHVDRRGKARMVDVGDKPATRREAVARGAVVMSEEAFEKVRTNSVAKGDVLAVAQIAGIQAAKKASELIPLCHPLQLDSIDVRLELDETGRRVVIEAVAATRAATGVEMEALTAAAVAGLTLYDMIKAVDREAVIGEIRLVRKSGGRSGVYRRGEKR
ncbi:MAG TPA: cyclic pyranopterin monophosphate synthase MoaC [Candidatus Polarisedimenticolia bacterium]|nr:cyclic pyranopterin monophosphate synthase MoaC [Candidatus Polarisedimenticolia bacterium]